MDTFCTFLSSQNPVAEKFLSDLKHVRCSAGSSWETLSQEDQDALVDSFYVNITNDPAGARVFPKLKIPCGEKINLDFDNEGWTWRDEHSGPFSWMTKSQQDLSLEDLYSMKDCAEDRDEVMEILSKQGTRGSQLVTPNASRGLSEIEAAFQKFGLKNPNVTSDSEEDEAKEQSSLGIDSCDFQDVPFMNPFSSSMIDPVQANRRPTDTSVLSVSLSTIGQTLNSSTSSENQKQEVDFFPNQSSTESPYTYEEESPVKTDLEDMKESSNPSKTDHTTNPLCKVVDETEAPEEFKDSTRTENIIDAVSYKTECESVSLTDSSASLVLPKTGLDFLDDW